MSLREDDLSVRETKTITCHACGGQHSFDAWKVVNAERDPEMKTRIMDGAAFIFTCPDCGGKTLAEYPMLYVDPEKRLMIQLLPGNRAAAGTEQQLARLQDLRGERLVRAVPSIETLMEKILIFDAGLDDRVIEKLKLLVRLQIQEEQPWVKPGMILFHREDNDRFDVYADGQFFMTHEYPFRAYELMYRDSADRLPDLREDGPVIDEDWVKKYYGIE